MRPWRDVALYFGIAAGVVWGCGRPDVTSLPFVVDVLPYAPPAGFLLIGYLGGQMNQSRLLFGVLAFLSTFGVLAHPAYVVPLAPDLIALALPLSLAMIFAVAEGHVVSERGLLRLLLAVIPLAGLTALLNAFPAEFSRLVTLWRLPQGAPLAGLPVAALLATLPLLSTVMLLRRDRAAPMLPAMLAAALPVFGVVALASRSAVTEPGLAKARAAIACTGAAVILLHAVVRLLWHHAYRDELTGLPNRRALEEELAALTPPYAVVMIDLDRFKRFNDRYGHDQGDQVLRFAGVHLRHELGSRVYRYGGEEFCVLLPELDGPAAVALAEQARRNLCHPPFRRRSGRGWLRYLAQWWAGGIPRPHAARITISAGVAAAGRRGLSPWRVRTAADGALYRAKAAGRNRVRLAGPLRPR